MPMRHARASELVRRLVRRRIDTAHRHSRRTARQCITPVRPLVRRRIDTALGRHTAEAAYRHSTISAAMLYRYIPYHYILHDHTVMTVVHVRRTISSRDIIM